jgi:hypothetical protein
MTVRSKRRFAYLRDHTWNVGSFFNQQCWIDPTVQIEAVSFLARAGNH